LFILSFYLLVGSLSNGGIGVKLGGIISRQNAGGARVLAGSGFRVEWKRYARILSRSLKIIFPAPGFPRRISIGFKKAEEKQD
jgi:hypothetical protein